MLVRKCDYRSERVKVTSLHCNIRVTPINKDQRVQFLLGPRDGNWIQKTVMLIDVKLGAGTGHLK
jgi:hypothetical protein